MSHLTSSVDAPIPNPLTTHSLTPHPQRRCHVTAEPSALHSRVWPVGMATPRRVKYLTSVAYWKGPGDQSGAARGSRVEGGGPDGYDENWPPHVSPISQIPNDFSWRESHPLLTNSQLELRQPLGSPDRKSSTLACVVSGMAAGPGYKQRDPPPLQPPPRSLLP